MKVTTGLKRFENRECTSITNLFEFDEKVLEKRKKDFYEFEKDLMQLSHEELSDWIHIFKLSLEQESQINKDMNHHERVRKTRIHNKGKLIFILNRCMDLAHVRTEKADDRITNKGRIVSAYVDESVKIGVINNTTKVTRKDQLKLK